MLTGQRLIKTKIIVTNYLFKEWEQRLFINKMNLFIYALSNYSEQKTIVK